MQQNFPTTEIFKRSAKMPLHYAGDVFVSFAVLIAGLLAAFLTMLLISLFGGLDPAALVEFSEAAQSGDPSTLPPLEGIGSLFLGALLAIAFVLMATSHIFNYWVNLAAGGKESARWSLKGERLSAAAINGLKFLFIGILIGVVNLVLILVLASFGLSPSLEEQAAITNYGEAILSGLTTTILSVVIASAIYSMFSANLTQTALRSTSEGLEHPHTVDFAIVLVLLYAIYLVPTVLFALAGLEFLTLAASVIFGLYMMFTVPIAHGLRYRFCTQEKLTETFGGDGPPADG